MEEEARGSRQLQRGRRSESRLRVRLPVRMETRTETSRVILVDLSTTGARILTENPPKVGTEAMLHWGRYEAFGEVVWIEGVQCGIAFLDPISPQDVLETRELDDAAHLPQDRELLRQAARHWVEGTTPR
ncbi:PilZ domain-containing protein [Novosphingobium endophyticum]|nr:PilZ domain-containing protein [Novosphingobium endophyticum]